ncbi:hypothetical protein E8Y11_001626 [Escherichia coli]|nr:hypothetical protein [Escherichia coli]
MANTWRFIRFSEKDDDGMNKESEIIDELIKDERHDCDAPEVTEWKQGEKPPCGVWLDCDGRGDRTAVLKLVAIGDDLAIYVDIDSPDLERMLHWEKYSYRIHINPKEKAMAQIAFALATKVIGEDAAGEINFNRDNDYSRDYRNMAQAIIDGCIGHVEYTGGK